MTSCRKLSRKRDRYLNLSLHAHVVISCMGVVDRFMMLLCQTLDLRPCLAGNLAGFSLLILGHSLDVAEGCGGGGGGRGIDRRHGDDWDCSSESWLLKLSRMGEYENTLEM